MRRTLLLASIFALILILPTGASAHSWSLDAGFGYHKDLGGLTVGMMGSYGWTPWFEFGGMVSYWGSPTEDEIDRTVERDVNENTKTETVKLRRYGSVFFGPLFRFPIALDKKERKYMIVPTLAGGLELYADREWEDVIHYEGDGEKTMRGKERDLDGTGWFVRPGVTFALSWARINLTHFSSEDGFAQFEGTFGVDIFRVLGVFK